MRKIILALVCICFLLAGCNSDSYTDGEVAKKELVSINLALNGDFEDGDFVAGDDLSKKNWGSKNAVITSGGRNGKGVELKAGTEPAYIFYNTSCSFSSSVTATADIKLSDSADATDVALYIEFCDGSNAVYEGGSFHRNASATTSWQEVTLEIDKEDVKKFSSNQVTVKVVKEDADSSSTASVLVDNVRLTVEDNTTVNFLPYGSFLGKLNGKWVIVEGSPWPDATVVDIDGKKAVKLEKSKELIASNAWAFNDSTCPRYDTSINGEFTFSAKGSGSITVTIERKNDETTYSSFDTNPALKLTDNWQTFTVEIGKIDSSYKETTVKIKNSDSGDVYITSAFLHYTEGK